MAAGWNADTAAGPVGSGTVTLVEGSSFCISSANGDIHPEHPHGVFHEDTRILSRWNLSVNGLPLEALTAETKEPYRALFIGRVPRSDGYADSPLIVERLREVGAGIREEITIRNYSSKETECIVSLSVESDFADLFEVKEARVQRRWEESRQPEGDSLVIRAGWQDLVKSVVVNAARRRGHRRFPDFPDGGPAARCLELAGERGACRQRRRGPAVVVNPSRRPVTFPRATAAGRNGWPRFPSCTWATAPSSAPCGAATTTLARSASRIPPIRSGSWWPRVPRGS